MCDTSSFIPNGRLYSVEQPHLIDAHLQEVEVQAPRYTGGFRSFWRASIPPLWATLAIFVALVAVAFSCSQHRVKGLKAGAQKRRLAGEDADPFASPPSPELEQLCISLGPWIPVESSPGNSRRSPYMVEEFFAEMETDEGRGAAPPVPEGAAAAEALTGAAMRGPAAESFGGPDGEAPGLSRKYPTLQGLLGTSQHALPPPASVQVPRPRPLHPFIHVPALQQGVKPRPWAPSISPFSAFTPASSQQMLLRIRELLLLQSLDADDAETLVTVAEQLAAYALRRLRAVTPPTQAVDAVIKYGRRFVFLNSIHSAAQAIGPPFPPWWQQVVDVTLKDCHCDPAAALAYRSVYLRHLARDLAAALLKYKIGGSPTPAEVLDLKRRLFCNPETPPFFWRPEWDAWRIDDKRNRVV